MIRVIGQRVPSLQGTVPTERMSRLSARRWQPGGSGNPPMGNPKKKKHKKHGSFSHDSRVDEFLFSRPGVIQEAYRYIGLHPFLDLFIVDTDMGHQDRIPLFVR